MEKRTISTGICSLGHATCTYSIVRVNGGGNVPVIVGTEGVVCGDAVGGIVETRKSI